MKHAAPAIRKAGGGAIINISSMAGLIGMGVAIAYQASKGAVRIMTKSAAVQYARDNIRVNSIHPGVVATQMVRDGIDPESRKLFTQATPLGREATVDEIATGALFLASTDSSYMNGAELVLDGG
jgi:cyclopentanol dehydrogenase